MAVARRFAVGTLAAAGVLVLGLNSASAGEVTPLDGTHEANACPSSRSNGMCIYYGSQNAWDANRAPNETLDHWYYPGKQTKISDHIHSITIYSNCTVIVYTQENGRGSNKAFQGTSNGKHFDLPNPFYNNTLSFHWTCN